MAISEYSPIILPGVAGFVFLIAAVQLVKKGELLFGLVFLASALILLGASLYHYRKRGTPQYGKTITFESWNEMPAWKRWAFYTGIILFLLLWGYLVMTAILSGEVDMEHIRIRL